MNLFCLIHLVIAGIASQCLPSSMAFRAAIKHTLLAAALFSTHRAGTYAKLSPVSADALRTMAEGSLNFSIGMDPYCYKQFDKKQDNHIPCSKETFLQELRARLQTGAAKLADGYAPFCKHLFVENFTEASSGALPITQDNVHLLRSGYVARTEKELPVLSRWFPKAAVAHALGRARFLDVILYAREQVIKENDARGEHPEGAAYEFDYYVISVKPQDVDHEVPMMPITMFRNTMIEEGGSGVALDREAYLRAVVFWQNHAVVRDA